MKKVSLSILITCSAFLLGQENSETQPVEKSGVHKSLILKTNLLGTALLMPSLAIENQINEKMSLQFYGFISPWKSIRGNHLQAYSIFLDGRYYFKNFGRGWFVGPSLGIGFFDITKWNYWNSGKYQRGYSIFMGAAGGYGWKLNEKWGLEVFANLGFSQGFYHGYETKDGYPNRYEEHKGAWNKSGEFLPYQGGVMLTYQLK